MKKYLSYVLISASMPFVLCFGIIASPYIWGVLCVQSWKKLTDLLK